jgi:hypothetical protein
MKGLATCQQKIRERRGISWGCDAGLRPEAFCLECSEEKSRSLVPPPAGLLSSPDTTEPGHQADFGSLTSVFES